MSDLHIGYVITGDDTILVQVASGDPSGYCLCSDDQTWPAGLGWGSWTALADDDPRITDDIREQLGWMLDGDDR